MGQSKSWLDKQNSKFSTFLGQKVVGHLTGGVTFAVDQIHNFALNRSWVALWTINKILFIQVYKSCPLNTISHCQKNWLKVTRTTKQPLLNTENSDFLALSAARITYPRVGYQKKLLQGLYICNILKRYNLSVFAHWLCYSASIHKLWV